MALYGTTNDTLTVYLAYGSPVKYLVHPEIRDSKFNLHALPGSYRGPSRQDETLSRAWVWTGAHGSAAGRHVTVDIAAMRIDERSVLARCDRNHPSHNPAAIDPTPEGSASLGSFEEWHHAPTQSRDYEYVWTAGSDMPTRPFLLALGSGRARADDLKGSMVNAHDDALEVVRIDLSIGGYEHDWTVPHVNQWLRSLAAHELCLIIVFTLPCSYWSALRFRRPGPAVLFDSENPNGIKLADGTYPPSTVRAKRMADSGLDVLRAGLEAGKDFFGESPVGRGKGSPWALSGEDYAKHVSFWSYPYVEQLMTEFGATAIYSDRCMDGASTQKTTQYMVSPRLAADARRSFGALVCNHTEGHDESLLGQTDDGGYASTASQEFTGKSNNRICELACKLLKHVNVGVADGDGDYVPFTTNAKPTAPTSATGADIVECDSTSESVDEEPPADPPSTTEGAVHELTAAQGRPRRATTDVHYNRFDRAVRNVINLTVNSDGGTESVTFEPDKDLIDPMSRDMVCITSFMEWMPELTSPSDAQAEASRTFESNALTIAAGRLISDLHGASCAGGVASAPTCVYVSDIPTDTIFTTEVLLDVGDGEIISNSACYAIGGRGSSVLVDHDPANAPKWSTPKHFADYLVSPQRALWRTAMEAKMEAYEAVPVFELVAIEDVLAEGHVILDTLWAFKIKLDKDGNLDKLGPRWCVKGGNMDRDIYQSFADVVKFTTVKVMACIRAAYAVIDFQFDVTNAFQCTRTDEGSLAGKLGRPDVYVRTAPGFPRKGADGRPQCCRLLVGMQGRIDSANLFSAEFIADCKKAGCYAAIWDPQLFIFHHGPPASSADDLTAILAACHDRPCTPEAPCGWAIFGRHVDDGLGLASSQAVVDYLIGQLSERWSVKCSGWEKVLGFGATIDDKLDTVSFSAKPTVEALGREHLKEDNTFCPKHAYSAGIVHCGPGVRPPTGSTELTEFTAMQTKCRQLLGSLIYLENIYPEIVWPVNYLAGFMSNPSAEVYKHAKYTLQYLVGNAEPVVYGGVGKVGLVMPEQFDPPFVRSTPPGLFAFGDANLQAPRGEHATVPDNAKSFTGYVLMLGCAALVTRTHRQHLVAPDTHTSESQAISSTAFAVVPMRGLLQEIGIPQARATIIYCDSQSSVYAANDTGATKRSVWTLRRIASLREFTELEYILVVKISEKDNVADGFTKAIVLEVWRRHMAYIHNKRLTL